MERGEVMYLNQLLQAFERNLVNLKKAYDKKELAKFEKLKKTLINIQQKVSEVLK